MHLWTRDRHLCDGLSHRHRWTWARHGIAVDESSEIIVVQLQLCAVARHAAKLPHGWTPSTSTRSEGSSSCVDSVISTRASTTGANVDGRGAPVGVARQTRADVVGPLRRRLARHERRRRELLGQHDAHRRRHRAELLAAHRAAAPVSFADASLLLRRLADAAVVVDDSLHKLGLLAADAEVAAPADRLQFVYRSGGQRHRVVVGLVVVVIFRVLRRWRLALDCGLRRRGGGRGAARARRRVLAAGGRGRRAAAAGVSIRAGSAAAFSRARVLAAAGSMPFLINKL